MWNRPPRELTLAAREAHVWRVSLDDLHAERYEADLSPEEAARRFLRPGLRERHVCAHGALRRILARYNGSAPAAIRFGQGAHGKPYLEPTCRLCFNLSHSRGLALVAVTLDREIGVDVEHIREVGEMLEIARRMFPAADAAALAALPAEQRARPFFRYWTRLEAHLKAAGAGIGDHPPQEGWSIQELDPGENCTAAMAIHGEPAMIATWEYEE